MKLHKIRPPFDRHALRHTSMSRARTSFLIWLLVFSTVMATLLPPVAHAYLHAHETVTAHTHPGDELRSMARMAGEATPHEQDGHLEYCPLCMHATVSGFPIATSLKRNLGDSRMTFVPPLYLFAPNTLFAWLIPSSRAPPLPLS